MDKITESLVPGKNTFDVFVLSHGNRPEYAHLYSQHQQITQPKKTLISGQKYNQRMSSVELWSTSHYLRILNEGNLTLKKTYVDDFRRLKKRYQTLRQNPVKRYSLEHDA